MLAAGVHGEGVSFAILNEFTRSIVRFKRTFEKAFGFS